MNKLFYFLIILIFVSCANQTAKMTVNNKTVKTGSSVTVKGKKLNLYKGNLKVGDNFVKKSEKTGLDFKFNNKVTLINVVPSIDTKVCEEQTHILGESKEINKDIDLFSISRDLPMAQARFAKEAKLTNIQYFSDYKYGKFGKKTGLMIKDKEILARAVIVLDQKGIVRHLQVVPELTELPDMKAAIKAANDLVKK